MKRRVLLGLLAGGAALCGGGAAIGALLYATAPVVRDVADHLFPRHRGVLVAAPGMTLADMRARSSVPMSGGFHYYGTTSGVITPFFAFELHGSAVRFPRCRIARYDAGRDSRIESLSVSVSPKRLRWARVADELVETRRQLRADGWTPRQEAGGEDHDQALEHFLHDRDGAAATGATRGYVWTKGALQFMFWAEEQTADGWVQRIEVTRADDAEK